jgi:bacterioferritin
MSIIKNISEIRARARQRIEDGAITESYGLDKEQAVAVLNEALATELVCVLRYRFHYFAASGINSAGIAQEFLEHANEEQGHADQIAGRIKQLGGKPEMSPEYIAQHSHSEYVEGTSLADMMREDLIAERIAIETYRAMIRYFGEKDPTTRRMLEEILAKEEEHADELADLLFAVTPNSGEEDGQLYFKDEAQAIAEHQSSGKAKTAAKEKSHAAK